METKTIIWLTLFALLTNNVALAGDVRVNEDHPDNRSHHPIDSVLEHDSNLDPEDKDHADHEQHGCHFHIQLQLLPAQNLLINRGLIISKSLLALASHLVSFTYSPPTPPPKV